MASRYQELLAAGKAMTPEERVENLRGLLTDQRAAALIGLVDWFAQNFSAQASNPSIAAQHGALAHAAGAAYGVAALAASLKEICDRPVEKKRRRGDEGQNA